MASLHECEVCWDSITKSKTTQCVCGFKLCFKCMKRILLNSQQEPFCISCKVAWTDRFMMINAPKSWFIGNKLGQYRSHYKKILTDREKILFPETLAEMEHKKVIEKERRKYYKNMKVVSDEHNVLSLKYRTLNNFVKFFKTGGKMYHDTRKKINLYYPYIKGKRAKIIKEVYLEDFIKEKDKQKKERHEALDRLNNLKLATNFESNKKTNFTYVCVCPKDGCNGMINAWNLACAICDSLICKRCQEIKKSNHKCDPDAVKTVKMLKKDSKPCPKCAVTIHRIHGCNQMFCTMCKTPFDWLTGVIITGHFHNPHAIEWQNRTGGQIGRRDGCGLPRFNLSKDICSGVKYQLILQIYQRIEETADVVERFGVIIGNFDDKLTLYREDFLKSKIDEKMWKRNVFLINRRKKRIQERRNILQTFYDIGVDSFRSFDAIQRDGQNKSKLEKINAINTFVKIMKDVRVFINNKFNEELKVLGTSTPYQLVYCKYINLWNLHT